MCGIVGIVDSRLAAADLEPIVRRMAATIIHRGPDDEGFYVRNGIALGMRRLSVIDLFGGKQPIANESQTVHVIQNGEIYNFRQLREALEQRGHVFATHSDTEVIAHEYEERGEHVANSLRGMFALALWDEGRQSLLIARDRIGKKPLFYAHIGHRFLFASEIKALLAAEPALAEPNEHAIGPYMRFGFVPEPETMFARIRKLPAAHTLVLSRNETRIERYWSLDITPLPGRTTESWAEELEERLTEAVRLRLISDVPLGVFLSGGLDSSAVAAYMKCCGVQPLKTFTIGFDRPAWDESADAARVARHLGTEHHELRLTEAQLSGTLTETLHALIHSFDEPFGDSSALPTYHVSRLAREHVTVILSGDGGDEVFAGYTSYRGFQFADRYRNLPWPFIALTTAGAATLARFSPFGRYGLEKIARVLRDSAQSVPELYLRKSSLTSTANLRRVAPSLQLAGLNSIPADAVEALQSSLPAVTRAQYADLRFRLLDDMLVKVDRMSMAHSLEVRSPLLDHELIEFVSRIPAELKLRGAETKALLRRVAGPKLPAQTLRKPKQGFSVPLREWLRGGLNEMVNDYLAGDKPSLPDFFDRAAVRAIVSEHRHKRCDHSSLIWLLLNYGAWYDAYIVSHAFSDTGRHAVAAVNLS